MKGGKTIENNMVVWSGAVPHVNPLLCPIGYACDLVVADIRIGGCKVLDMLAKVWCDTGPPLRGVLCPLQLNTSCATSIPFACRVTLAGQSNGSYPSHETNSMTAPTKLWQIG